MTGPCIHGVPEQQCTSCRRCAHGILESRCGVCAPRTARESAVWRANDEPKPSETHRGYEILYATGERSWYYRADADSSRSNQSFRSPFGARKAIDQLLDAPPAPATPTKGKRSKS
jgi:hypothetical protein